MAEPTTVFTVLRLEDGTLYVDWSPDMYPVVDPDGKDTDRVIDLAEDILGRTNEDHGE